ncbi:PAS domain S-box protein [Roseibium denhamense]|uniref:histidine kinase n=1 Tax=Roseibium denhamense TaxID=76305 RepID=A0ABY1P4R3_9HYPH|nr:PAS domain S-box protein [Roseibium denhamense]MTI07222.1 PAS domain S-box protein [Roseibium denhamense]SMP26475.1 two-component system, LuxR family, sensor kinase FixL [Roseibium denhamense]
MAEDGVIDRDQDESTGVSEARLASVFDTAADGIIVINDRCQILAFNKACERLFGYEATELLGQNVARIMPASYASAHDQYVHNYLTTGHKKIIGIGREVRGRHKDGAEFPVELSVGEAATPCGRQFIGILRDLRPRKQIEDSLAKTQAQLLHMTRISALDEMGAAIAHELNQPLTAVLLYLQSASRKAKTDAALDPLILDIMDKAVREAERASEIIQRMRSLVEKKAPERQSIYVAELVKTCVEMAELGTVDKAGMIRMEVERSLPPLQADPVQIRQILINLLRNAREAVTDVAEPAVVLAVSQGDDTIEFRIQDNGPGVPPHLVDGLFKAFTRMKHKGVGLGLAISRSIAQNHGGDLRLETTQAGKGASFLLSLPVHDPAGRHHDDHSSMTLTGTIGTERDES